MSTYIELANHCFPKSTDIIRKLNVLARNITKYKSPINLLARFLFESKETWTNLEEIWRKEFTCRSIEFLQISLDSIDKRGRRLTNDSNLVTAILQSLKHCRCLFVAILCRSTYICSLLDVKERVLWNYTIQFHLPLSISVRLDVTLGSFPTLWTLCMLHRRHDRHFPLIYALIFLYKN